MTEAVILSLDLAVSFAQHLSPLLMLLLLGDEHKLSSE